MRMVDRKTFLTLPAGTMYYQGKPWVFDGLMIKGKTLPSDDWTYCDPCSYSPVELEHMQVGERCYINSSYGRDGRFDEEDLFIVLEAKDLDRFRSRIIDALSITKP